MCLGECFRCLRRKFRGREVPVGERLSGLQRRVHARAGGRRSGPVPLLRRRAVHQGVPDGHRRADFIQKIATGNVRGAARTIFEQNILGILCARVCPVEVLARAPACTRLAAADRDRAPPAVRDRDARARSRRVLRSRQGTGKRVALVGAGPASLACADDLALRGTRRRSSRSGRSPAASTRRGSRRTSSTPIARPRGRVGPGARRRDQDGRRGRPGRDGEELERSTTRSSSARASARTRSWASRRGPPGRLRRDEWIERMKTLASRPRAKRGVVVGGGNTAIDAARGARLGAAQVTMVYRGGEADMSGYEHERTAARRRAPRRVAASRRVRGARGEGRAREGPALARRRSRCRHRVTLARTSCPSPSASPSSASARGAPGRRARARARRRGRARATGNPKGSPAATASTAARKSSTRRRRQQRRARISRVLGRQADG